MAHDEIERKWLVAREDLPQDFFKTHPKFKITQHYLTKGIIELRIRRQEDPEGEVEYTMAVKTGGPQSHRKEWEKKISENTYCALRNEAMGGIEKERYFIEPHTSIDIYSGEWEGTIVLEIENSDEDPPFPTLAEVTKNTKYYTSNMIKIWHDEE